MSYYWPEPVKGNLIYCVPFHYSQLLKRSKMAVPARKIYVPAVKGVILDIGKFLQDLGQLKSYLICPAV